MSTSSAHNKPHPQSYYESRRKIYPREVHGHYQNLRILAMVTLLGLFYIVPWLQWDGRQAVLFDLPARKFYVLGLIFWPQDFFYLAGLLIVAALSLFLFTAISGRLWCGYACPQTVWTESFIWIERVIEGGRARQMKLDQAPWTTGKSVRKVLKHGVWITFALWTGFTFVGFFTPIRELTVRTLDFGLGPWETFWILFYAFATYGNAGWLREQVCIYMCPYARFQSAMFDRHTLIVSYDKQRGEPRGGRRRGSPRDPVNQGDCVDCTLCVQVCPTGIDIRDGLQYQCIGCAACVDVCNSVMDKMGYDRGLVSYTSEASLAGEAKLHLFRPRTIIYSFILISLITLLLFGITQRALVEIDVIRDRNALYREPTNELIENVYTIKILNKDSIDHAATLSVSGIKSIRLDSESHSIIVAAGEVHSLPVRVLAPRSELKDISTEIAFQVNVSDSEELSIAERARFLGPDPNSTTGTTKP